MSMLDWAKNEVELACKKENPDWDGESFDYGCSCYKSALKAYESLMDDEHSGMSWSITRSILIRLMNGQNLTPIEDTEDVWSLCSDFGTTIMYQCKRLSSLFKDIHNDGTTTYSDTNRAYGILDDADFTFSGNRVSKAVDSLFPIKMPYYPATNKYKVMFHSDDDDYPYAIITPDGDTVKVRYSEDKGYEKVDEES